MALTRRQTLRLAGGFALGVPLVAACEQDAPPLSSPNPRTAPATGHGPNPGSRSGSSVRGVITSQAPLPAPFTIPLPVPPVLRPVRTDATTDYYSITQQSAKIAILPGLQTEVWGYNGIFPGPTLVSRRGRRTVVTHRNQLPRPVSVHLHGGRTPPEHDGYPTDLIAPPTGPGPNTRDYVYPMDQAAATLWYHDHRMDFTGPQVYKGLAGFHLVHDDVEDALPLPRGDRDIPLMICDRAFAADGSMIYPAVDPTLAFTPGVKNDYVDGVLGDCILVNGAPWPVLQVTAARYRFRFLNASNARRYQLALDRPPSTGPSFTQIGSDVGLLGAPVGHTVIPMAPAERFDVVIDFSGYRVGDTVTLLNQADVGGTGQIMRFVVARTGTDSSSIPAKLTDYQPLSRADATVERTFFFTRGASVHGMAQWTVNGAVFDTARIDANPQLGSVELWTIRGRSATHPFHIHLAPFQVLSRGRQAPAPQDGGWKDTVDLENGDDVELLVKFDGYPGKYIFHCHNLEHEDMGMMANFQVQ